MDPSTLPTESSASAPVLSVGEFDPWSIRRKVVVPVYKTFTDGDSGVQLRVGLQPIGTIETCAALQEATRKAQELGVEFSDEDAASDELDGMIQGVDGEAYELNFLLIKDICFLRAMQPEAERRDFLWWLGVATHTDDLYTQISNFAAGLKKRPGNGKRANRTTTA